MHIHINHMFCTEPCWPNDGTKMYWCRYLVAVQQLNDGQSGYDPPQEDWVNLTEPFEFFDEEEYNRLRTFDSTKDMTDEQLKRWATKTTSRRLKPEVIQWLEENVKDRKDTYPKGWCIGSDAYVARDFMSISIFFHRRADALKFIKEWSVYKKPTTYFDYFKEISKVLNFETGKLELEKR